MLLRAKVMFLTLRILNFFVANSGLEASTAKGVGGALRVVKALVTESEK